MFHIFTCGLSLSTLINYIIYDFSSKVITLNIILFCTHVLLLGISILRYNEDIRKENIKYEENNKQ